MKSSFVCVCFFRIIEIPSNNIHSWLPVRYVVCNLLVTTRTEKQYSTGIPITAVTKPGSPRENQRPLSPSSHEGKNRELVMLRGPLQLLVASPVRGLQLASDYSYRKTVQYRHSHHRRHQTRKPEREPAATVTVITRRQEQRARHVERSPTIISCQSGTWSATC